MKTKDVRENGRLFESGHFRLGAVPVAVGSHRHASNG
jgi:hypothetical protein